MRRITAFLLVSAIAVLMTASSVAAVGWGPRVGMTADPDQAHLGMHLDGGEIAPRFRFQPNFEVGVGDDRLVAAFNFEGIYLFDAGRADWRPYMGGGIGMYFIDRDRPPAGRSSSSTDIGLNFVGGMEWDLSTGNRLFTEVKFGLVDAPGFKWTMGYTFMH